MSVGRYFCSGYFLERGSAAAAITADDPAGDLGALIFIQNDLPDIAGLDPAGEGILHAVDASLDGGLDVAELKGQVAVLHDHVPAEPPELLGINPAAPQRDVAALPQYLDPAQITVLQLQSPVTPHSRPAGIARGASGEPGPAGVPQRIAQPEPTILYDQAAVSFRADSPSAGLSKTKRWPPRSAGRTGLVPCPTSAFHTVP